MKKKKKVEEICWQCGTKVIWNNDFMRSELGELCQGDSEDKVVSIYTCPKCGATYQVMF